MIIDQRTETPSYITCVITLNSMSTAIQLFQAYLSRVVSVIDWFSVSHSSVWFIWFFFTRQNWEVVEKGEDGDLGSVGRFKNIFHWLPNFTLGPSEDLQNVTIFNEEKSRWVRIEVEDGFILSVHQFRRGQTDLLWSQGPELAQLYHYQDKLILAAVWYALLGCCGQLRIQRYHDKLTLRIPTTGQLWLLHTQMETSQVSACQSWYSGSLSP